MISFVQALENKSNPDRSKTVEEILRSMGISVSFQNSRLLKIKNIIVDFLPDSNGKRLIFSAHYDAAKDRPGANDNASGVAVLLGLCRELKKSPFPARIIFFDREEAWLKTTLLRLGLLGSLYYVFKRQLRDISAVYNVEYCGQGEVLGIWPVKEKEKNLHAVKVAEAVAADLALEYRTVHIPWLLLSSDHLSFRFKGVSNSITLSLMPASQLPVLERMVSSLSVTGLLMRRKPEIPYPLSIIHTPDDTSSHLNEGSLKLMLNILTEIIKKYNLY